MADEKESDAIEVLGQEVVALIEQSMGSTGLQILGAFAGNFLLPNLRGQSQEEVLSELRRLTFRREKIGILGEHILYECQNGQLGKIAVMVNMRNGSISSTLWAGERDIPNEAGTGGSDRWKVEANYSISQTLKNEVQFTGGINSFTHGETGIKVTTQAWFKYQYVAGKKEPTVRPIAIFSVHKGDQKIHSVTIPTTSLLFPVRDGRLIPSPEHLSPLEPGDTL